MNVPFLGSMGIENLRYLFQVRNRPTGRCRFPDWNGIDFRCSNPCPTEFFRSLILNAAETLQSDQQSLIQNCEVAPGICLLIEFSWENGELLRCSSQAIVVPNGTLTELISTRPPRAHYYRLDFSVEERGNLFDHPFPHTHTFFDGAPRFSFFHLGNTFPLFHWIEFLMINHHYPLWSNWAIDRCQTNELAGLLTAEREVRDFFEAFSDIETWNEIPANERTRFVEAARQTIRQAAESASEDFPKIPNEYLALNYWQQ